MKTIIQSILLLLVLTLLTGIIYPLLITGVSQLLFPKQANGSLITRNGKFIGSELIGQSFTNSNYFNGRPSASDYDATNSGGFNLGTASSNLINTVSNRIITVRLQNSLATNDNIPPDMVLASSSGLDPDISVPNALIQVKRIAKARKLPESVVKDLIEKSAEKQIFGFWGMEKVNVLKLNRALDSLAPSPHIL